MRQRGTTSALLALSAILLAVQVARAEDGKGFAPLSEQRARENLAQKLLNLSQSLDMREASYPDSKGGGKDFNTNDGNAFTSNTTYHSYVWDRCLRWVGGRNCARWLDPYVSPHGAEADRSPLEGAVYDEWNKRKQDNDPGAPPPQPQGNSTQYVIWDIKRDPSKGDLIKLDGRLNREAITEWKLQDGVKQRVEQIGTDTAQRQINLTYDENSGTESNTMPNMESLRMMAGRWAKMFRNRLVANLGELRAADIPSEIGLGEDYPDCNSYAQALENEFDQLDEKRRPQAPLDEETRFKGLQQRIANCQKLRNAPVYAVNPEVSQNGDTVQEGDKNLETVDKWRARVNIALVDSVGRDPESLPRPGNAPLERYEYDNDIPDWDEGGRNRVVRKATNAEQLASYNKNLQDAAVGMKEISMRTGIRDNSQEVLKYQIAATTRNLVELNGITREMRGELESTNFYQTASGAIDVAKRPEKQLEETTSQLTIRRLQ
jgi:hypothetical protein